MRIREDNAYNRLCARFRLDESSTAPLLEPSLIPKETQTVYKLMKVMPVAHPNEILPLFAVDPNTGERRGYMLGKWYRAEVQAPIIGNRRLAKRSGIHAVGLPIFDQGKVKAKSGGRRVWVEALMPVVNPKTQKESDDSPVQSNGQRMGIRDRLIEPDEAYDFKTQASAKEGDSWPIAGSVKLVRILTDGEVRNILKAAGKPDSVIENSMTGIPDEKIHQMNGRYADSNDKTINNVSEEFRPVKKTETPEFKRWFGGSKVVDRYGEPLKVYHGSPDLRFLCDDGKFKNQRKRFGGLGSDAHVHWFTSSYRTATTYADAHRAFDYQNAEEGVVACYLKLENPLVIDAGGDMWRNAQKVGKTSSVIEKAQTEGHDGIIIRNVKDDYVNDKKTVATDTYAVFSPTQIKSASGNWGTFDLNRPNIFEGFESKSIESYKEEIADLERRREIALSDPNSAIDPYGEKYFGVRYDEEEWGEYVSKEAIIEDEYNEAIEEIESKIREIRDAEDEERQHEKDNILREELDKIENRVVAIAEELGYTVVDVYPGWSTYITVVLGEDVTLKIRISNHYAPKGSGFDQGTQGYYEPPDINIVAKKFDDVDFDDIYDRLLYYVPDVSERKYRITYNNLLERVGIKAMGGLPDKVKKMVYNGYNKNHIWKKTGWWQGIDEQWRFELPIFDIKRIGDFPYLEQECDEYSGGDVCYDYKTVKISDLVEHHAELLDFYKNIGDVVVYFWGCGSHEKGSSTYYGNVQYFDTTIHDELGDVAYINIYNVDLDGDLSEKQKNTLFHEIQHVIQRIEGFEEGANFENAKNLQDLYKERLDRLIRLDDEVANWIKERDEIMRTVDNDDLDAELENHNKTKPLSLSRMQKNYYKICARSSSSVYKRMAGEVEARVVSVRGRMTSKQRKSEPPWETEKKMLRDENLLPDSKELEDVVITRKKDFGSYYDKD